MANSPREAANQLRRPTDDQEILRALIEGVDEGTWAHFAGELRSHGYSIFDLAARGSARIEIIDPECANWWQLAPDVDGLWQLS